jgi:collagenase-like PrtC family protease
MAVQQSADAALCAASAAGADSVALAKAAVTARGKHAKQVVVAIARELVAFMWAMTKQVAVTP